MNNYKVVIMESGSREVTLTADSEEDAIDIVRDLYETGELELYSDIEFECVTL